MKILMLTHDDRLAAKMKLKDRGPMRNEVANSPRLKPEPRDAISFGIAGLGAGQGSGQADRLRQQFATA